MLDSLTARFPKLMAFIRQPTTIIGLGTIAGLIDAVATGLMPLALAIPPLVGAVVAVAIPEQASAATVAAKVAADAGRLADPAQRGEAIKALTKDALDLAGEPPKS